MAPSRPLSRRLAPIAGAALAAVGLVACNALIGLDDFDKGECAGGRCDGGSLPDVFVPDSGTQDAQVDGGKGADPVSWARWKMPNYDAGADSGLVNPLSYSVNGSEITDLVTKTLIWRDDVVPGDFTYDEAVAACAGLAGSWRLPKRIELVTLLDFARPDPFKVNEKFKVKNVTVWTSSEVRPFVGGDEQRYWSVNFMTGEVLDNLTKTASAKALCVKAK